MQGDSCLMKVNFLENSLKVKKENHLLFVKAASDFFPLLLNLSLLITAFIPFYRWKQKRVL